MYVYPKSIKKDQPSKWVAKRAFSLRRHTPYHSVNGSPNNTKSYKNNTPKQCYEKFQTFTIHTILILIFMWLKLWKKHTDQLVTQSIPINHKLIPSPCQHTGTMPSSQGYRHLKWFCILLGLHICLCWHWDGTEDISYHNTTNYSQKNWWLSSLPS